MIDYREEVDKATLFREEYLAGFDSIIDARRVQMRKIRAEKRKDIFLDAEKHRKDFQNMLGWPLTDYDPTVIPSVKIECLAVEDEVEISRCSFEVLEGLKLTGLLFKKRDGEKRPLVIVQHGGAGTPELISQVYGDTYNYRDMLPRVLAYDVHAFAPQLLLWDENKYGTPHDRRAIDAKLKSVGSSVTAVEVYGIRKILDYFQACDYVSKFGMVGLSYGGFYTLFTAAIDTRIQSALSSCFFNDREKYAWPDWVWWNSCEQFSDCEVAALIYPRPLFIEVAQSDPTFVIDPAKKEYERLKSLCPADWCPAFHVFEGVHEFNKEDTLLEKAMAALQ